MVKNLLLEYSEELATKCELLCKSINGNANTVFQLQKSWMRMVRTLKDSFWNSIEYVTYRQEEDEELLKFLVLFSWQALHLCPQMRIVKCFATAKREIICCRILWNIALCSMWNEINPLTPAGISLAVGKFHARSAFHKSRKGFISLRSVLKDTALKRSGFLLFTSLLFTFH